MSLDNWAFLQTRQHSELKQFLSEYGFQPLSDWALLNRARVRQLEQLSDSDRHLVEAFHQVYRRDRRSGALSGGKALGKCADPTIGQLTEMQQGLAQRGVICHSPDEVFKSLKQVASQLRQVDLWSQRLPLEVQNVETGQYELRQDLPAPTTDGSETEQQEFLAFLQQQLQQVLTKAIAAGIAAQVQQLEKSKTYAPFAARFRVGLQRYYSQGLSLREIGPQLGMSSWDQTRRILNPGDLLNRIRSLTVQQLFDQLLKKAQAQGWATTPPDPDYVKTLATELEAFVDSEIFAEAVTELKAGKNRSMDSVYAQYLKQHLEQSLEPVS